MTVMDDCVGLGLSPQDQDPGDTLEPAASLPLLTLI